MNNYEKIKEILIKNEAYFYLYNWFNKLNKIKYYKCNVIKFMILTNNSEVSRYFIMSP